MDLDTGCTGGRICGAEGGARALGRKEGVQGGGGAIGRSWDLLLERSAGHPGAGDPSSQQSHFPAAPGGSELGSEPGALVSARRRRRGGGSAAGDWSPLRPPLTRGGRAPL